MTEYKIGEEIWYYPIGKELGKRRRPYYRRKAKILKMHRDKEMVFYMVEPPSKTMFPTFVGSSVLEKVK